MVFETQAGTDESVKAAEVQAGEPTSRRAWGIPGKGCCPPFSTAPNICGGGCPTPRSGYPRGHPEGTREELAHWSYEAGGGAIFAGLQLSCGAGGGRGRSTGCLSGSASRPESPHSWDSPRRGSVAWGERAALAGDHLLYGFCPLRNPPWPGRGTTKSLIGRGLSRRRFRRPSAANRALRQPRGRGAPAQWPLGPGDDCRSHGSGGSPRQAR